MLKQTLPLYLILTGIVCIYILQPAGAQTQPTGNLPAASSAKHTDRKQIELTVKDLGLNPDNLAQDLHALQINPQLAVSLLVAELHPIPRRTYYKNNKTKESRHIIGCLRGLRYLTGITFSATTKAKLNDDEKQFLDFKSQMHDANPEHEIHFFGVWMSRDAEFVAPVDAQRKIIEQWRQWQSKSTKAFKFPPPKEQSNGNNDWYWWG